MRAECLCLGDEGCHDAPSFGCECGIYAVKEPKQTRTWHTTAGYGKDIVVVGKVELWGRIVRHEEGYRAQFAYPKKLVVVPPSADHLAAAEATARELAKGYGIPVRVGTPRGWLES